MKQILAIISIFFQGYCTFGQGFEIASTKEEVLQEMHIFYDQMRNVDLTWMDYLSDDATAVHNGEFINHEKFLESEKHFFNALTKLEITVLTEPVIHELCNDAASVTQEHSINIWYKDGKEVKDIHQMLTFLWNKRNGKWKIVHADFTTIN